MRVMPSEDAARRIGEVARTAGSCWAARRTGWPVAARHDAPKQAIDLVGQDGSAQRDTAVGDGDVDGAGVSDHGADARAYSLEQDIVADLRILKSSPQIRHRSLCPIGDVSRGGIDGVPGLVRGVDHLVTDEGASAPALIGIEKV